MSETLSMGLSANSGLFVFLFAAFIISALLSFKVYRKTENPVFLLGLILATKTFSTAYIIFLGIVYSSVFYACLPDGMCLLAIFPLFFGYMVSFLIGVVAYALIFTFFVLVYKPQPTSGPYYIENSIILLSLCTIIFIVVTSFLGHQKNLRQNESSRASSISRQTQSSLFKELRVPETNKPPLVSSTSTQSISTTTSVADNKTFKLLSPNGGEQIKIGTPFTVKWQEYNSPAGSQIDSEIFKINGDKVIFGKNGECTNCVGSGLRSGLSAVPSVFNGIGSAEWKAGITYSGKSTLDFGSNYVMKITVSRSGAESECPKQTSCTVDVATDWSDSVFRLW